MSIQTMPAARVVASLISGAVDYALMPRHPVLEQGAIDAGNLADIRIIVAARRGHPFRSPKDLSGRTLAAVRDTEIGSRMFIEFGATRVDTVDLKQAFRLVLGGRVDALLSTDVGFAWVSAVEQIATGELLEEAFSAGTTMATLWLSRAGQLALLAPSAMAAVEDMKRSGEIDSAIRRYIPSWRRG